MNDFSNISALIVDDSILNRQLLRTILEEDFKLNIKEAENGVEALELLNSFTPDLVVLDLMMPIMDGVETLKRIREKGLQFPVVILTADIQETTREKCLSLGVSGFLNKPSSEAEIINFIAEILNKIEK